MELITVRAIDDLGRLVLPKEVRQANNWTEGTPIAIYTHNSTVLLEAHKPENQEEDTK